MGKSIRIIDLARKMIQLSGFEVDKDIKIKFSGLREGEKLYEELLSEKETTLPTHHQKIMIAKTERMDHKTVKQALVELYNLLEEENELGMILQMKNILPEFVSNSSRFEKLDEQLKEQRAEHWKISRKIS
jgi:FlaA1/EpsC-like NDP-sugar epimerase